MNIKFAELMLEKGIEPTFFHKEYGWGVFNKRCLKGEKNYSKTRKCPDNEIFLDFNEQMIPVKWKDLSSFEEMS